MLKLRTDTRYVSGEGKLTQAGVEAIQGQIDAGSTTAAGLNTRLTAVETELAGSLINLQTAIASASQTSIDFTGIPSWVNRITVMGRGISTNGTSPLVVRVGDGTIVSTGYMGAITAISGATPASANDTTGCLVTGTVGATSVFRFTCQINRASGNQWVFSGSGAFSSSATTVVFGSEVSLSGALDRVRLTALGGVDQFDAGSVNISWE